MTELASPSGGIVVNVDGAGSRGEATPRSAAYGSSKAAIPQLTKSLAKDAAAAVNSAAADVSTAEGPTTRRGGPIGVHTVSPGMVTTALLLGTEPPSSSASAPPMSPPPGVNKSSLWVFNILAERPETVAAWLVPRMRALVPAAGAAGTTTAAAAAKPVRPIKPEYIRYLTETGGIYRFLTAPSRKNRLFDLSASAAGIDGANHGANGSK